MHKALLTIQVNMFLFDGAICKSIVMMWIPTVIVTQPLDLMKTISREQLSDSRDMGFVHSFWLESVLESTKKNYCQLTIIIAKSVNYFFFCELFLTPWKTFQVTQFRSRERRKLHFRESNFTNFPGGMPLDPPRSSCLRSPAGPLHPVLPSATENPDHRILYLDNHSA